MRIVDADAMLSYLKQITVDMEHSSVLISDASTIMGRWVERQPTIVPKINLDTFLFDVIDPKTGEYPDVCNIALTEDWAKGLVYCDIDRFVIGEDGCLLLLDECGNYAYCPPERFQIKLHMEAE